MKILEEMRNWEGKPKELFAFLTDSIRKDEKLFSQLIEILETGSDVEKGTCADVMKHISKDKPELQSSESEVESTLINRKHITKVSKGVEKVIPRLLVNNCR